LRLDAAIFRVFSAILMGQPEAARRPSFETPAGSDPQHVGRYLIKEELAAGGMGVVYRAVDTATGEECALKRVKVDAERSKHSLESFEREYRVLAGIDHPRIIRVHEYGVDDAGPYYTMELIEGNDLRKLAPLHYREACRYLRDVAGSLALLHARRLLHRDLSPRNVRVSVDGRCKLLDFGALTGFGPTTHLVGTPPAVPPEAARGGALDQRSDLYALGALAYWLLTGKHAYPAKRLEELPALWAHELDPPSALRDDIPPQLDDLVLGLLRRDPMARPGSAAEVIGKLNAIAQLQPEDEDELTKLATSFLAMPHFVGRKHDLELLQARLEAAVSGRGGAVVIEGAPGTGRTRLLEELGLLAEVAGAAVLRVDASMHKQLHGTARTLVRHLLDAVPRAGETTARLTQAALAQVGDAADRMRLRHSMPVPSTTAEPSLSAGVSLEAWLADVSDRTPLLIQIDNVEYADDSSLGVLAALARGSRDRKLLLVVAQKAGTNAKPSVGLTALLPHCERVSLGPLDEDETLELARSLFGEAANLARFSEFLYARTAGNPLHCIEVARQLIDARVIRYLDGNWALPAERPDMALPTALEGALSARLASLSQPARQLAECLSLHKGELSLALCRKLMGKDGDRELFALQDELARNDVLHGGGDGFRFSSTVLQETLLAEMDAAAREHGHRRLGEALLQLADARNHALHIQAGWHLLRGGQETLGADLIAAVASDSVAVRLVFTDLHGAGESLEAALAVYSRERRPRLQRLPLLSALAQASYYEDRRWGERYGDEALDMLEDVSGLRTARHLSRYFGRFLGLVFGIGVGFLRFVAAPRRERTHGFGEVLIQLFGAVTCLTAVAALSLDAARARVVTEVLRPFSVLPERLTPVGILEFCDGLRLIALERQAEAAERFERLLERMMNPRYYPTLVGEMRKIYIAGVHFARAVFATYADDGSRALESANALDALDIKFYAMIASQIRFLYHMNRGDFRAAQQHRQQVDIHAAHVGSAWQVETWEPAALIPVYTMLLDVDGMARVADRLEILSESVPSLRQYAGLARWAQGLVLSDATRSANAVALAMIENKEPRSYIGWAAHLGFTAMGSRILGNHDVAKRLCDMVLAHTTDADREFVVLFLAADIERAWCEASAGRPDGALALLDALIERHADSENPIVHGLIHEARADIAHAAGRESEYAQSAAEVERWFRPLGNPALTAKCERLIALRARGRSDSGRRENAEVTRWLDMLAGYEDLEERVEHGLQLLRRSAEATGAAFYRRRAEQFVLDAQTEGAAFPAEVPEELLVALQRYDQERSVRSETATAHTELTVAPVHVELAAQVEGARDAYLLIDDGPGREVIGAVTLTLGRGGKAPPNGLLRALARTLTWDDATVAEPTRSLVPKRVRASR
jgi:hypothetical protein